MTYVTLNLLDFGEDVGHPFRGNQYTGGQSDGVAGETEKGMKGQGDLREAMSKGLGLTPYAKGGKTDPNVLIDANERMRQAAKAEVVAAAGADITRAAETDPEVQREMSARYPVAEGERFDASQIDRDALIQEYSDNVYTSVKSPLPEDMTNEQLYGQLMAQLYVDTWAVTAADSDPTSLALQTVAAETLGAHSNSFDDYLGGSSLDGDGAINGNEMATMRAFVQGEYDRTQDFLKENGIKEVTLYRGFSSDKSYAQEGAYSIDMNPASSWSVDRETAVSFSWQQGSAPSPLSYVLTSTFPASDIISTARTGQGALHEGEVIVRNQEGTVAFIGSPDQEF